MKKIILKIAKIQTLLDQVCKELAEAQNKDRREPGLNSDEISKQILACFNGAQELRYTDIVDAVMAAGKSRSTAERRVKRSVSLGIIERARHGFYTIKVNTKAVPTE